MKNIYLILSILLLFHFDVFSQNAVTLKGIVSDSDTGMAIEYATVQLLAMPDSTLVSGVVTKKDGSFSLCLSKPGKYCVMASYIGYNSFSKQIYYKSLPQRDVVLGNLKLSFDAIMLDEDTEAVFGFEVIGEDGGEVGFHRLVLLNGESEDDEKETDGDGDDGE